LNGIATDKRSGLCVQSVSGEAKEFYGIDTCPLVPTFLRSTTLFQTTLAFDVTSFDVTDIVIVGESVICPHKTLIKICFYKISSNG
jgi:hypothetical protein